MGKLSGKAKRAPRKAQSKLNLRKLSDTDYLPDPTDLRGQPAELKAENTRVLRVRSRSRTSTPKMEEDEDDMYAPEEEVKSAPGTAPQPAPPKEEAMDEDEVEGEESEEEEDDEEEDDDSDIEIVTETQPGAKPEPPAQNQRIGSIRGSEALTIKPDSPAPGTRPLQSPAIRGEVTKKPTPPPQRPGSSYPAIHSSTIDLDAKPIHDASGKPITDVDMDADFGEDDKPWRRPGSDQTDYFNYGFDEFTWSSYRLKQDSLRKEAKEQKKQLEDMQNFMGMGAGAAGQNGGAMAPMGMPMGGQGELPPEVQQAMQSMIQQGIDPTAIDFNQFMQMMGQGGQSGMGQQGYGQQGNQQQMGGYGYGGGGGHAGPGGGHGGHGGRGRGRGRW